MKNITSYIIIFIAGALLVAVFYLYHQREQNRCYRSCIHSPKHHENHPFFASSDDLEQRITSREYLSPIINNFIRITHSANKGVYFSRAVLDSLTKDIINYNGVFVSIGAMDSAGKIYHPLLMEQGIGDKNLFEIGSSDSCYISRSYRSYYGVSDRYINSFAKETRSLNAGVFFPTDVITTIMHYPNYTGVVIYISSEGNYHPLIMEGTKEKPVPEQIPPSNRIYFSKTYCPRVCGTL